MIGFRELACTVSLLAIASTAQAHPVARSNEKAAPKAKSQPVAPPSQSATGASDQDQAAGASAATSPGGPQDDIVVTGIRESLERAAEIKRDAVQVVDSIVAQDIGKLPDPTTASALQRVPGIQVSNNRNNELGDVRIRGLPDILTTVNGREVFTTTGRNFDLQDMPAEALQRIDVYKSQTADLIEGGLAGIIDLRLNRPFDFKTPTLVMTARGNYGRLVGKVNPQFGLLASDSWDTSAGKIGVLVNGNWSRSDYYRAQTQLFGRRSTATGPLNTPGLVIPNILQNFPEQGYIERREVNAAVQWQATPHLQAYVEGFYTYFRDRGSHNGANIQPFTVGTSITSYTPSNRCITARVRPNGLNPVIQTDAQGNQSMTPYTVQDLCEPDSITFANLVSNQTTQARDLNQQNKSIAGGFYYDKDDWHAAADLSYQTSAYHFKNITSDIGQRLSSLTLVPRDGDTASYTVPGDALLSRDNLYIRNALIQNYTLDEGALFAVKGDLSRDFSGFLKNLKAGARYARRTANSYNAHLNTPIPGGNIGTGSEATAVKVSDTGLPSDFLTLGSVAPDLNNGTRFYIPNADFLLNESSLDLVRAYFGLPSGRPDYQPDREFDAREETVAGYAQGKYSADIGSNAVLDGVVGVRFVQTNRLIRTYVSDGNGGYTPVSATTTDRDWLPSATMRLKFDNGFQARLGYSKSLRRPNFGQLNPAVTLNLSNNPLVQSTGSAGNPNLKSQRSQSFDATLAYYAPHGYIAVAAYYRDITNRVINDAQVETIDGVDYAINRPRNVGQANLKGIEVSGQYFLQFLPGALGGLGVQGAFTYADSKIQGDDPLAGNPLQGVSKYNYTVGLLYEKYGISGRLVYTYRSKYFESDETGSTTIRPIDPNRVNDVFVPTLLGYARAAGRLDFNIGYDVTPSIRIDVGGTNILASKTASYYGYGDATYYNHDINYDETTYSIGVRVKF